jgi:hypothetical protein
VKCFEVLDHTADIGLIVPETPEAMAGRVKCDSLNLTQQTLSGELALPF